MAKRLVIISYGTPETTAVYLDDKRLDDVQSVSFNYSVDDIVTEVDIKHVIINEDELPRIDELDGLVQNLVNKTPVG